MWAEICNGLVPGLRSALLGTCTIELEASKEYAVPMSPGTPRVTFLIVPSWPDPESSTMTGSPGCSSMCHRATTVGLEGVAAAAALTGRSTAASIAPATTGPRLPDTRRALELPDPRRAPDRRRRPCVPESADPVLDMGESFP